MKIAFAGSLILVFIVACEKKLNLVDTNSPTQESYFKTAVELEKRSEWCLLNYS